MKLLLLLVLTFGSALSINLKPIYEFSEWWAERDFDSAQWNQSRSGKIIGGQEASPHQFPFQVALMLFTKGSSEVALCSGSLISTKRVISAAHCCVGQSSLNFFTFIYLTKTFPRTLLSA